MPTSKKKSVTIKDIAAKAGVTKATVSMVINNDPRITQATREKVLKVVKALDYVPSASARRLALGRSEAIAFLAPRFAAPPISGVMDGLELRAALVGRYADSIQPYSTRNKTALKEALLKDILRGGKAEAVIMVTVAPSPETLEAFHEGGVPVVLVESEMPGAHSIRVDNVRGAYKATAHLCQTGRKRIALFNGPTSPRRGEDPSSAAQERLAGYKQALAELGRPFDPELVVPINTWEYEEAALHFDELRGKAKFDAVFCAAGDLVAMGVIEAARQAGMKIPQDLAVVGYDDILPARLLAPSLTTVHQEFQEMGSLAFDLALQAVDGKLKAPQRVVIDPELVVRESA